MRPVYGLAAVAAGLVVAALWFATPRPPDGGEVVRNSELIALSPSGATSSLEFKWQSPLAAAKYRLVIRDAGGTVVFSGDTTALSINIDTTARSRFATMVDYSWTVSGLDASGEVIAESSARSFTYQP